MKLSLNLHDASEERPAKSCKVVFMAVYKNEIVNVCNINYSKKYDAFNADDIRGTDDAFEEDEKGYKSFWCHSTEIEKSLKGLSK